MNDKISQLISMLPATRRDAVSSEWQDFVSVVNWQDLADGILDELFSVWCASPRMAEICLRQPETLQNWSKEPGNVPEFSRVDLKNDACSGLSKATEIKEAKAILRTLRNREMLRIFWRDLTGQDGLDETLQALSDLADCLVDEALNWLGPRHEARFGLARNAKGEQQGLVVIGMGKLGGHELNFSSDIDLIFAFPESGESDGARQLSSEEYFRRLAVDLVGLLNERTAEGFVFRVDTRLRPFGDSGPLVMNFEAMENYYQTHGREWERYAWIKARPVAGDLAAGERLLKSLQPFIYRRYLDFGAFDAMREMKAMIEQQTRRKGMQDNIKLGAGGIREIEFIAQVFQLIHGGRHAELRDRRLRRVLQSLVTEGMLAEDMAKDLDDAYVFLRRLENRIQAYADEQTHKLPGSQEAQAALAFAMGDADWVETAEKVKEHRESVSEQFERVFLAPQTETSRQDPQHELILLWQGQMTDEEAIDRLSSEGYESAAEVLEQIKRLRDHADFVARGEQSRRRLDRCVVLLLAAGADQPNPDITTRRLLDVLHEICGRSSYVALLVENPTALSQLVRLCSASPWIAKQMAQSPMLLDSLLDVRQLYQPLSRSDLADEIDEILEQVPSTDIEQRMNLLRRFKQAAVLRIAAADVADAMPLMVVSDRLTDVAEVVLEHVLEAAWAQTVEKHGEPLLPDGGIAGLLIVAYGKLGGIELGYGSDLDLVFVHDGDASAMTKGPRQVSHEVFFARLGQRIIHWLNTYTPAGRAYEVDMRLRPNGQSGLLVSSLQSLDTYQKTKAWTWEHQALIRARPVVGKSSVADSFRAIRAEVLSQRREEASLLEEVVEMREKMRQALEEHQPGEFDLKQGEGGIADIEFIVQFNVLRWGSRYPQLFEYTDNIRILEQLDKTGLWSDGEGEKLAEAYRELRRHTHRLSLQDMPNRIPDDVSMEARKFVRHCWQKYMQVNTGADA